LISTKLVQNQNPAVWRW